MLALMMFVAHLAAQPGETAPEGPVVLRTTTAPKPEKIRKEDLVCRKEALVGTRMKTKICLTQAEWDQRQAAYDLMRRFNAGEDVDIRALMKLSRQMFEQ